MTFKPSKKLEDTFVLGIARLVAWLFFIMVTSCQLLVLGGRINSGVKFAPTRAGYVVIVAGLAVTIGLIRETQVFLSWIPVYVCLNLTRALCLLQANRSLRDT